MENRLTEKALEKIRHLIKHFADKWQYYSNSYFFSQTVFKQIKEIKKCKKSEVK